MTFINNTPEKVLEYNAQIDNNINHEEENEANIFSIAIKVISILLLIILLYFGYKYFSSKNVNSQVIHSDIANEQNSNNENNDNSTDMPAILGTDKIKSINKEVETKKIEEEILENNVDSTVQFEEEIFKISSSNPEGYYVMVGTFSDYKNAIKLQKMNPTEYTCHIFEPNYNDLNRVGLFISEKDERKAKNALTEIRNMQKDSWLLLNEKN